MLMGRNIELLPFWQSLRRNQVITKFSPFLWSVVTQQLHYSASEVAVPPAPGELKHFWKLRSGIVHGSVAELSSNQTQIPKVGFPLLLLFNSWKLKREKNLCRRRFPSVG